MLSKNRTINDSDNININFVIAHFDLAHVSLSYWNVSKVYFLAAVTDNYNCYVYMYMYIETRLSKETIFH